MGRVVDDIDGMTHLVGDVMGDPGDRPTLSHVDLDPTIRLERETEVTLASWTEDDLPSRKHVAIVERDACQRGRPNSLNRAATADLHGGAHFGRAESGTCRYLRR